MSCDLNIWSVRPFERAFLGGAEKTSNPGKDQCTLPGKGWQIVINASDRVLPEDVDDEISALVSGIAYFTQLNLEGNATAQARKLFLATAKEIAKRAYGVLEDPQSDNVFTPAGVKRFIPPKKEKTFSVLNFTWWFLGDQLLKKAGREEFIALLGKLLPEALPKRYGDYEPPQHLFEKTGKEHLEKFMQKQVHNVMVWYPNRPVTDVHISFPKPLGPGVQGFRANYLEIQVESAVLAQPGWADQLNLFWRRLTFLLEPFYGEVRSEGGYMRHGATVAKAGFSLEEDYPFTNRSWFWRGVPRKLGHAVVLGKKYQSLWPDFAKSASVERGFAFASLPDWSGDSDLSEIVGQAPNDITLLPGKGMGPTQKYPKVWPFDSPFGTTSRD